MLKKKRERKKQHRQRFVNTIDCLRPTPSPPSTGLLAQTPAREIGTPNAINAKRFPQSGAASPQVAITFVAEGREAERTRSQKARRRPRRHPSRASDRPPGAMNRFRLFVLHKLERRQTLGGKPDDSRTANEMTRSIRRVARRFGVVLGVRSRAGDDTLVVCAEQTTLDGKPRRPKKTVRFDIKPEVRAFFVRCLRCGRRTPCALQTFEALNRCWFLSDLCETFCARVLSTSEPDNNRRVICILIFALKDRDCLTPTQVEWT